MPFDPTPEQVAIVEAARTTTDNLIISALAGAAKTSTLELICRALPSVHILSLAFNKKIADEMKARLPGNVECMTLNSIGHRTWAAATGRRLRVEPGKSATILKAAIDDLPEARKTEAYDGFSEILKTFRWAKVQGYVPDGSFTAQARPLVDSGEFFGSLEEIIPEWQEKLIDRCLIESIRQAFDGLIDFDDQPYMPTIFGGSFPQFPLVMVDEAQDLSPLNHAMLKKIARKRLIAVGDPNQSIYAFRGAVTSSMRVLGQAFNMRELTLSISFRCPQAVVRVARFRAPHMQWPEWAKPGSVDHLEVWSAADIPDGSAIVCRNNAPLMSMALRLLQAGRGVHLVGTDLGPQLIKAMKKFGETRMSRDEVHAAIDKWEQLKLAKSRAQASVRDRADCFRVFADFGETLGAAIAYAETLFAARGPVQLMTGHKSKGLEFDTVFFLDQHLVGARKAEGEAAEQEENLRYVIVTRAKDRLAYVTSDTFAD